MWISVLEFLQENLVRDIILVSALYIRNLANLYENAIGKVIVQLPDEWKTGASCKIQEIWRLHESFYARIDTINACFGKLFVLVMLLELFRCADVLKEIVGCADLLTPVWLVLNIGKALVTIWIGCEPVRKVNFRIHSCSPHNKNQIIILLCGLVLPALLASLSEPHCATESSGFMLQDLQFGTESE